MRINTSAPAAIQAVRLDPPGAAAAPPTAEKDAALHKTFNSFVGQTMFGQMIKAMRKTVGKPAYLHGGMAEDIFQQQLDQILGEKLSTVCGAQLGDPMFKLSQLSRR